MYCSLALLPGPVDNTALSHGGAVPTLFPAHAHQQKRCMVLFRQKDAGLAVCVHCDSQCTAPYS
jgi:hypothetical protein